MIFLKPINVISGLTFACVKTETTGIVCGA
jgi:hypothetical protein